MDIIEKETRESYLSDEEVELYCKKYLETWNKTEAYLAVHPETSRASALSNVTRYHNNPKIREYLALLLSDKVMGVDEVVTRIAERARDSSNKHTQLKALELIARIKGLFIDRTDITSGGERISWNRFISENQETTEK
ncbi:MAG: hypothetical protein HRF47_12265 [Chloroflexota bacterium]|jgi:phage terminase small subunit